METTSETTSETTLEEKVERVLDQIRPFLREDGGDINLIEITDDMIVKVQFTGACTTCSMQSSTFKVGVEDSILKSIPEIQSILVV